MAEVVIEKEVCLSCGVERRENTQFCYNCGTPIAEPETKAAAEHDALSEPEQDSETPAEKVSELESNGSTDASVLDGLTDKIRSSEAENEKLAKAAAERKKARVGSKRTRQYVWEADEEDSGRLVLLVALLVTVIAAAVVFVTIRWR